MTQHAQAAELEQAAIRLWEAGIRLTDEPSGDVPGELPRDFPVELRPLLAHAGACVRCGELIRLFQEVHAAAILARADLIPTERAWTLRPRLFRSPIIKSGAEEYLNETVELEVAASTTPSDAAPLGREHAVLTLTSDDQKLLVRIFRNEGGAGATAILVSDPTSGDQPAPRLFLRLGGREFPFGPDGTLSLPDFPAAEITFVAR